MSLINEALKKAQRQRSLDAAPLSSAPSGIAAAAVTTYERAATHRRRRLGPLWFGLGILALGIGSTVLVMRYGFGSAPSAPVVSAPTPPAPLASASPAAAPVPVVPAVIAPTPPASSEPVSQPLVHLPAFTPQPAPVVASAPTPTAITVAKPAVVAPVAVTPVPVPTAVAPVAESPDVAIRQFLDSARITGVRGSGAAARVLMNERVYRLGEVVALSLDLRLSAVHAGRMVFTDSKGKTHEKTY